MAKCSRIHFTLSGLFLRGLTPSVYLHPLPIYAPRFVVGEAQIFSALPISRGKFTKAMHESSPSDQPGTTTADPHAFYFAGMLANSAYVVGNSTKILMDLVIHRFEMKLPGRFFQQFINREGSWREQNVGIQTNYECFFFCRLEPVTNKLSLGITRGCVAPPPEAFLKWR